MRINKSLMVLILFLLGMVSLMGCEKSEKEEITSNRVFQVYYLNREETKIEPVTFTVDYLEEHVDESKAETSEISTVEALEPSENGDLHRTEILKQVDYLIAQLAKPVENTDLKPVLNEDVRIINRDYNSFRLELDFTDSYYTMKPITEVLTRAAIVRTLTQIEDVDYVIFRVKGHMMTYSSGIPIGTMKADSFVENAGAEISASNTVKLVLFFANESKDKLVKVTKTVDYNTNISLEKLVMEQLIQGPGNSTDVYPVMSPDTKVVTVTTKDGVCYVNFDSSFLNQIYSVSPEVVIYSITNSLVELPKINKVQITVDGETDRMFRDTISLKNVFERDLNLVE